MKNLRDDERKQRICFCLSDDRTQHLTERGARAFYCGSFHSTVSVGIRWHNIYDDSKGAFSVLMRERREWECSLSNIKLRTAQICDQKLLMKSS